VVAVGLTPLPEARASEGPAERRKRCQHLEESDVSSFFMRLVRLRISDGTVEDWHGQLPERFKPQRPCRSLSVIDNPGSPVPHL
jgi:hypothetical protein